MREPGTYEVLAWSGIAVWISATALVSTNTGVEGLVIWAYLIGIVLAGVAFFKRKPSQIWLASVGLGVNSVFCLAALLYWRMD